MFHPTMIAIPIATLSLVLILAGCTPKEEPQKKEPTPGASTATQEKSVEVKPLPSTAQTPSPSTTPIPPREKQIDVVAVKPSASTPVSMPVIEKAPSTSPTEPPTLPQGDIGNGQKIFNNSCQSCHGKNGNAGVEGGIKTAANFANIDANPPRIKDILLNLTPADHMKIVKMGGAKSGVKGTMAGMPAFGAILSEQQIADVIAYERSLPAFKNAPKK